MQHGLQLDRAVALEHVLQVAELVVRIGLHQQHADLLLADADQPLLAVVVGLGFVGQVLTSMTYSNSPTFVGRYGRRSFCGLPSASIVTFMRASTAGLSFSRSTTSTVLPAKPRR